MEHEVEYNMESEQEYWESEEESSESEEEFMENEEEQMEDEDENNDKKSGDDLLRSVWFYFGMPVEYIQESRVLTDKPFTKKFIFFVAKAVVTDILENRNAYGLLFKNISDRCSKPNTDALRELDTVIGSQLQKKDPFSGFITFCAILADFVLYMRCKGNFMNIDRKRLLLYWVEYYEGYFEDQIKNLGGLDALLDAACKKAGTYPYNVLKRFTAKYCNPDAAYNERDISLVFKAKVQKKYQNAKPIALFK